MGAAVSIDQSAGLCILGQIITILGVASRVKQLGVGQPLKWGARLAVGRPLDRLQVFDLTSLMATPSW